MAVSQFRPLSARANCANCSGYIKDTVAPAYGCYSIFGSMFTGFRAESLGDVGTGPNGNWAENGIGPIR
jgi:hypothetical protein